MQTVGDDVMRSTTVHVRDKSEAAGVMFVRRVIQALVAGVESSPRPAPNVVL